LPFGCSLNHFHKRVEERDGGCPRNNDVEKGGCGLIKPQVAATSGPKDNECSASLSLAMKSMMSESLYAISKSAQQSISSMSASVASVMSEASQSSAMARSAMLKSSMLAVSESMHAMHVSLSSLMEHRTRQTSQRRRRSDYMETRSSRRRLRPSHDEEIVSKLHQVYQSMMSISMADEATSTAASAYTGGASSSSTIPVSSVYS
jgi:hypothetical protein